MTVAELIAKLNEFPPDADVVVGEYCCLPNVRAPKPEYCNVGCLINFPEIGPKVMAVLLNN